MNVYDVGDFVRISGVFMNQLSELTDPTTVTLKVETPAGVVTTYVYPASVTKDSLGNYHVDVSVTEGGDWYYQWFGTGAVQAAEAGQFVVKPGMI